MMTSEAVPNKTHHIEPNRMVDSRDSSYTARARKANMAAVLATDSIASDPCTCCAVEHLLGWATAESRLSKLGKIRARSIWPYLQRPQMTAGSIG